MAASAEGENMPYINHKPSEHSVYVVEWGKVKIPLVKYANPEVYSGTAEVQLSDFKRLVGERLRLLKAGRELEIELVSIYKESTGQHNPDWSSYPVLEQGRLSNEAASAFRLGIRQGDLIALRLSAPADSIIVQSAVIKVTSPYEAYEPAIEVPHPRYDADLYGFQVIQEPGRRPLLRIDTTSAATRHIYEMYRNNRLYKIIHIPGFQTRHRLIAGPSLMFPARSIHRSVLLGCGHDWLSLPEYTDLGDGDVRLLWGEMAAAPSSQTYLLQDLLAALNQPLRLMVGEQELPIRSFHLITHGRLRKAERYVADKLQEPALLKALCRLEPASTVYFDKVVIENERGQLLLFPQAFAFNIGTGPPLE